MHAGAHVHHRSGIFHRRPLTIACCLLLLTAARAVAGNCPNSNPNDGKNDSVALQWCLDNLNTVILDPGDPGYIVNTPLWLRRNNQTITSSRKPRAATLIAGRDLFAHMLQTEGPKSGFVIEYLTFNGRVHYVMSNKTPWRKKRDQCTAADTGHPGNVVLEGTDFIVRNSSFLQAICGGGLAVLGDRFTIQDNVISRNGRDMFASRRPGRRRGPTV
jgi:hypothetical protein